MVLPLTVREKAEKSGLPKIAAISGVRMLVTNEVTTAPKAPPITTATARSITLPRKRNFLNPANMSVPPWFDISELDAGCGLRVARSIQYSVLGTQKPVKTKKLGLSFQRQAQGRCTAKFDSAIRPRLWRRPCGPVPQMRCRRRGPAW